MNKELIELTSLKEPKDLFKCVPGEAWGQGFATYGGFVAASCYRAAKLCGHLRPLLSAQVIFLAPSPLSGYLISVEALRVGKRTSIVEVCTWSPSHDNSIVPDTLLCKILFTYGEPRASNISVHSQIEPDTMEKLRMARDNCLDFPQIKNVMPDFLNQFHFRNTVGTLPYSNSSTLGHVFAVKRKGNWKITDPMEYLVLISDISLPPQLQLLDQPAKPSSMSWMVDFSPLCPDSFNDASWIHVALQLEQAQGGYGAHSSIIVDDEGHVLTCNRQVTAVFETEDKAISPKNLLNKIGFKLAFNLFRAFSGLRQHLKKMK